MDRAPQVTAPLEQRQSSVVDDFLADCCKLLDYHRIPEDALGIVLQMSRDAASRAVEATAKIQGFPISSRVVTTALDAAIPPHLQQAVTIKRAMHKRAEQLVYMTSYLLNYV